jgi:hypothetical protein
MGVRLLVDSRRYPQEAFELSTVWAFLAGRLQYQGGVTPPSACQVYLSARFQRAAIVKELMPLTVTWLAGCPAMLVSVSRGGPTWVVVAP